MVSDKFFSDDYLDQLNPQKQAEQGPVTVFGLTFKDDEASQDRGFPYWRR